MANPLPSVVETDWRKTISTETGLGLGVYATFLQLAIGPEVGVERSNKTVHTFAFDAVTTVEFEPTKEYVEQAIKVAAVQAWLRQPKQRFAPVASLFLVTGMKLVKGASLKYSASQSVAATGNFSIDLTALGVLGTAVGPKGHWISAEEDGTELNRESEFVFAFRVKRLKFGWKNKVEDYNKGAFLNVGGDREDDRFVLIEDVDGASIETAEAVPDVTENGSVYCVPPQS